MAYNQRWQAYCRKCNGYGGAFEAFDPSPAGVGLPNGHMVDIHLCPDCFVQGKCPRCGLETLNGDYCTSCEWDLDATDGVPDEEVWVG